MALQLAEAEGTLQIPEYFVELISLDAADTNGIDSAFRKLADEWHEATKFTSNTNAITENDSYRQIVDMGEAAIPLILNDLEQRGGDWFAALEEITGEQPVATTDYGFPRRMKDAWLGWGRTKGYLT